MLKVFDAKREILSEAIHAPTALPKALRECLINDRQRADCDGQSDDYKKADKLLDHIRKAIVSDTSNALKFATILDEMNLSRLAGHFTAG